MQSKTDRSNSRTTLAQVARQAGVSTATASLVLRDMGKSHRIAEATRQRVRKVAEELDYAPNLLVRSMQGGSTQVLSFFNAYRRPNSSSDLYMGQLLSAIQRVTGERGCDLLIHCDFSRAPQETYKFLNGGRADGLLLFAPEVEEPLLPLLRRSRLPTVLINSDDEEGILSSVRDDMEQGMRLVAEAFLTHGHTRIAAVVESGDGHRDLQKRIELLRQNLAMAGVTLMPEVLVPRSGDRSLGLREALAPPDAPTALFCWRDSLAYLVLEICEKNNISVPERVSIIGYDGIVWPSTTRHTATSVRVEIESVGTAAVELLDRCIRTHPGEVIRQILPVSLTHGTTLGSAHCQRKDR
jgi:DNA-binding LacI/PurR family transcriptional regulator